MRWFRRSEKRQNEVRPQPPNSLNIYPQEKGGVKFEYMDNPEGPWQQCLNDGRWYHVHFWHKNQLRPPNFPDEAYYSPKELAQVIGAEDWRRFFERRFELLEKISPWIFLGAMGIIALALLIFMGN